MLILSEQEIQENYQMKDAIQDLKRGLLSKQKGTIESPHRTVLSFPDYEGSSLYMPSSDIEQEIAAVKVVSIFPQNPWMGKPTTQGVLLLTSGVTGEHICMMDASYLTRLRTGALSAIATEKFARSDSKTLGVIGTGGMAFEQVIGVTEVRDIEKIVLYNRTMEKADTFKDRLLRFGMDAQIEVVQSSDEAIEHADIINCATRSLEPVFNGESLREGTHINGVGSFLPSMREVDQTTINRASKIIVDDLEGVKDEAGELIHADKHSDWKFTDVYAELSELADDEKLHRRSDEEITFFKSVGAAYFDLVTASGVYHQLKAKGIGTEVSL